MSEEKIVFFADRCKQALIPLLSKPWKCLELTVDMKNSNVERNRFHLFMKIDCVGKVRLTQGISTQHIPDKTPLFMQSGWRLCKYIEDPEYRNNLVFEALEVALNTFTIDIKSPIKNEIENYDFSDITTLRELKSHALSLSLSASQGSYIYFLNVTELIPLGRLLQPQQLDHVWESAAQPESWRDRTPLF